MDERDPTPQPQTDGAHDAPIGDLSSGSSAKKDSSGVVGWALLIALAIGVLALRFFGGGGC